MRISLPPDVRLLMTGVVRSRDGRILLQMEDLDVASNRPVVREILVRGVTKAVHQLVVNQINNTVSFEGTWQPGNADHESSGYLEVLAVREATGSSRTVS